MSAGDVAEARLSALERLVTMGSRLTEYDHGALAALRRTGDATITARVDGVLRADAALDQGRKR
ncbi:hypothetical protein [Ruania halotolerans]|uniref:hypothetical protein n=1 Tax=Ruania halotolerans TaxID=2897773 RepID=UPI001E5E575A|nr:hypothetical protein [Ruania halotolerans]UFU06993.1 hypothetical protein LQF10_02465 [Ruania halotolerans]